VVADPFRDDGVVTAEREGVFGGYSDSERFDPGPIVLVAEKLLKARLKLRPVVHRFRLTHIDPRVGHGGLDSRTVVE
jgi:hypothetical protein